MNEILNHRHVPEAEKKSFDKLKFLGVDIVDGDKIMINASSSKDSQLLRDFLEGLGIQFEITYEGMCG